MNPEPDEPGFGWLAALVVVTALFAFALYNAWLTT
jgi:hypothetical protein